MNKKFLSMGLLAAIILATNAKAEYDGTISKTGSCGNNPGDCNYTLYTDGHLEITGNGAMKDFSYNGAPWHKRNVTSVNINEGVTSVGNFAFYSFDGSTITSVTFPDSLISIGTSAFQTAQTLTTINWPQNPHLTTIGSYAFGTCGNLGTINLPNSVTDIKSGAFYNMYTNPNAHHQVVVPDSIVNIETNAFYDYHGDIFIEGNPIIASAAFGNWSEQKLFCKIGTDCSGKGISNDRITYYEKLENGVYQVGSGANAKFYSSSANLMIGGTEEGCETVELCAEVVRLASTPMATLQENADGSYTLYDINGNIIGYKNKRIYTVEEATKLSKETGNTFKLRYK